MGYFGTPVISINIKQAIEEYGALCKYRYHLHFVGLTDDEQDEYRRLSRLIAVGISVQSDIDALRRQRANLLAHTGGQILLYSRSSCREPPERYKDAKYQLVYVGEGRAHGAPESSIARVSSLLGNDLDMRVSTYTSTTPPDERQRLQLELAEGRLQALLAMRCLDEGIDIPEARIGIILASTQNPRQFVQRRGRLLRTFPGKVTADIHDVLVLPDRSAEPLASDLSLAASGDSQAYELADAAANRTDAMHVIRDAAIKSGLYDLTYPWMRDNEDPLPEWTHT